MRILTTALLLVFTLAASAHHSRSHYSDEVRELEGELVAVGEPVHTGRSVQLWTVAIRRSSDDKLVARGQVRFHILDELPTERRARRSKGS